MASTKLPKVPKGLGPKGHGHTGDRRAPKLPPIKGPSSGGGKAGKSGKK
jgi:hypothetical protein